MRITLAMVVGLLFALAATVRAQGLYWESTMTGANGAPRTTQTYAVPKMLKVVDSGGRIILIRSDQDKVITIDTAKKTYTEITFSEMEKTMQGASKQVDAAMAQMQEKMKGMPPEQRAMVEKMMKGAGVGADPPAPVVVTKTTETKDVAGHTCTKYEAKGGRGDMVVWATKDIKGFDALRDDYKKLQERMASMGGAAAASPAKAYAQIDGFPMQSEFNDIKTVVTKVEPRAIPAAEFDIPAGYEKKTMPMPGAH